MAYMPTTTNQLAVTGAAGILGISMTHWFLFGVMLLVIGGVILTMVKLVLPRLAVDFVHDNSAGKRRLRVTRNGKPITWPWRKR